VFLPIAVINSRAQAQHRTASRPCNAYPRVEIPIAGMKEGVRARAEPAAGAEIEWNRLVIDGVQGVKEVVANSSRDGQIGRRSPFVLHIAEILCFALPHQWKNLCVRR